MLFLFFLMALELVALIWYNIAAFSVGWNIFSFLFFFIPEIYGFFATIVVMYKNRIKLSNQVMKAEIQVRSRKTRVRERQAEEQKQQAEEQKRQWRYLDAQKFIDMITSKYLLIDSNIWMKKEYDILIHIICSYCKRKHSSILIPRSQLDELDRLTHSDVKEKRVLARRALKTIEYFQLNGIIKTAGIQARMQFDSYADPSFIDFFLKELQINGASECVFLTDDIALRVRLNAMTIQKYNCLIKVFSGHELLPVVKEIYKYEGLYEIRRIKREK